MGLAAAMLIVITFSLQAPKMTCLKYVLSNKAIRSQISTIPNILSAERHLRESTLQDVDAGISRQALVR